MYKAKRITGHESRMNQKHLSKQVKQHKEAVGYDPIWPLAYLLTDWLQLMTSKWIHFIRLHKLAFSYALRSVSTKSQEYSTAVDAVSTCSRPRPIVRDTYILEGLCYSHPKSKSNMPTNNALLIVRYLSLLKLEMMYSRGEHAVWQCSHSPLADSFLVLMILAAYSCPVRTFTHLRTTENAPLGNSWAMC